MIAESDGFIVSVPDIGVHVKDIISLIVGYGGGDDGKDADINPDYDDDDGYWSDDWDYYGFSDRYYY